MSWDIWAACSVVWIRWKRAFGCRLQVSSCSGCLAGLSCLLFSLITHEKCGQTPGNALVARFVLLIASSRLTEVSHDNHQHFKNRVPLPECNIVFMVKRQSSVFFPSHQFISSAHVCGFWDLHPHLCLNTLIQGAALEREATKDLSLC